MSNPTSVLNEYSEIKRLKTCFNSLDGDGSGHIGIEELEEPLIGLGFAETRDDVQEMINQVDEDGSGEIEFPEFLNIIRNTHGGDNSSRIFKFFKDMANGSFQGSSDLSFNLLVQKMRREHLLNAIMSNDMEKKQEGEKILKNVSKHIQQQKQAQKKALTGMD